MALPGSWSDVGGAHIKAFTFSSQDHGRLSGACVWCVYGVLWWCVVVVRVCGVWWIPHTPSSARCGHVLVSRDTSLDEFDAGILGLAIHLNRKMTSEMALWKNFFPKPVLLQNFTS